MSAPTPEQQPQPQQAPPPQPPKPGPHPPQPQQQPETPPWGDDFDPQKAWSLIQNLRGDKDRLKTERESEREELERLRTERLSADEKALQDAVTKAQADARSAAEAELRPKYLAAELKGIASSVITDKDQLKSFLEITDAAKFVGENGDIDEEKVMGHLTALFVANQPQRPRQWGQYSAPGQPPERPGNDARKALEKRHGVKQES